jgi:hypothetical protein
MRHSKASTTTDVYMQSLEPEVRMAINSIHNELMGNGSTGPDPGNGDAPPVYPQGGRGPSTASVMMERSEANSKLSQGDDLILRGLGVKWEPETGARQSGS